MAEIQSLNGLGATLRTRKKPALPAGTELVLPMVVSFVGLNTPEHAVQVVKFVVHSIV